MGTFCARSREESENPARAIIGRAWHAQIAEKKINSPVALINGSKDSAKGCSITDFSQFCSSSPLRMSFVPFHVAASRERCWRVRLTENSILADSQLSDAEDAETLCLLRGQGKMPGADQLPYRMRILSSSEADRTIQAIGPLLKGMLRLFGSALRKHR